MHIRKTYFYKHDDYIFFFTICMSAVEVTMTKKTLKKTNKALTVCLFFCFL